MLTLLSTHNKYSYHGGKETYVEDDRSRVTRDNTEMEGIRQTGLVEGRPKKNRGLERDGIRQLVGHRKGLTRLRVSIVRTPST